MPLEDILLCCLAKKGLTAVMELLSYARRKGAAQMAISKQGYLKQRKNLNPEVFTCLNHCYLEDFYSSGEAGTWNGYLLPAADGSKAEIPNSAGNKKTFGCARNQNTKEGVARALVSGLYFKRWGIETKYNTLKNKIKFESVTGNAPIYVYQDFYAQVLAYNMVQDIRRCADTSTGEAGRQKGLKHPVKTNENIAIGLFKERMVKIILEGDHYRQALMLSQLQKDMEKHVVPEREVPGRERKKNKANKYCINQKYSF